MSSIAGLFFPLVHTGHDLLEILFVDKGFPGTLSSATAFVFTFVLLFAYGGQ